MKRIALSQAYCIATPSSNISSQHPTMILNHTITSLDIHVFFSEAKRCYSSDATQANLPHFSLFLSSGHGKGQV